MQNILSNKWITKYYDIDLVYLKICIWVHIVIQLYVENRSLRGI